MQFFFFISYVNKNSGKLLMLNQSQKMMYHAKGLISKTFLEMYRVSRESFSLQIKITQEMFSIETQFRYFWKAEKCSYLCCFHTKTYAILKLV